MAMLLTCLVIGGCPAGHVNHVPADSGWEETMRDEEGR
jgi:hypothetical protein